MADFPPVGVKEDSKKNSESREDNRIKQKTEGGYQIIRARSTKRRSRLLKVGFTNITAAQKTLLENFERDYGSSIFTYDIPYSGETVSVTLETLFEFDYDGIADFQRWNVSEVTLREV